MRSLLSTTLLLALLFCSCEKNDTEPVPSIDVKGTWQLAATMPSPDTTWHSILAQDSAYYVFGNDQFVFDAKTVHLTGTYKVLAGDANSIKIIITGKDSLSQYLQIEKTSDSTIRVDDWLKGITKGYTSRKFKKLN
jgi:hypothetical protein